MDGARRFLLVVTLVGVIVLASGCQKHLVQGKAYNPYTPIQVKRMMEYHGALVAKFDGRQWWFLAGRHWIRLESAGAYKYALLADSKNHSDNNSSSM